MFSTPENLLVGNFWSSQNECKPFSKQKCVLRICCRVSQKQCLLELSNLCHCVQNPWKLTSRDYGSSRHERKPLSKLKYVFRNCSGVSQKWWMLEFSKSLPLCFSTPENLQLGISGALGMNISHFLNRNVFWEKYCGVSQKQCMLELSNLCHCVQHPWKLTSRHFWSSRHERKPLSQHKMCFENKL